MSTRAFGRIETLAALCVPVAFAACTALACSGLKRADDPPDAGPDAGEEQPSATEDAAVADGGAPDSAKADAIAPPPDFECTTDPWTKAVKGKKECEPRQVSVLEAVAPVDTQSVAIARTPAGRVGIVFNSEEGAETGEMHLAHFMPTTPTYAAPVIEKLATGFAFHDGYKTKIAASAPDTLAVLSYDMDDSTRNGEVHLRKLVGGKAPLTDDLVATAVKNPTEIAVASDLAGTIYATYRVSTGATTAKLAAKTKTASGAFTALPDVTTSLAPVDAPGIAATSLLVDSGGQLHLLVHYNETVIAPQHSSPRYHALAGSTWSYRKTVDNNAPDGLSGYSPSVAVFGTKKYAAFFFRKAGQPAPATADLRLARWDAAADTPVIEILDQQIPSADALYPAYSVALAVDKFGLLHLAFIRPTDLKNGYLEYRRQVFVAGGGTKWLSDIVDPSVISDMSSAFVDMVVDDSGRPHIAYRSAKDGLVRYATRFDR